jgi:general nucleoside transport system permease protein
MTGTLGVFLSVLVGGVAYGTPLLIAGLGELLNERGGVLNLGVEGMMLVGAASGFWIVQVMPGPSWLVLTVAVLGAGFAAACLAAAFAVVCLSWRGNQVVAGLALAILGGSAGLSSYIASVGSLSGAAAHHQVGSIDVAGLATVPFFGPLLFGENAFVYLSLALAIGVSLYLHRTRWGLNLRAVGEDPGAADAAGINVLLYRYVHTTVGGFLAGVGGAVYSLALTPSWTNGLTAGAGWLAVGLVIAALWRPGLLVVESYLFGFVISLGFALESAGIRLVPELASALPYVATVVLLVVVSSSGGQKLGAPMGLGRHYSRGG